VIAFWWPFEFFRMQTIEYCN